MSTTIDQKVVEMRFDNKNFETNAKTSMSTLDKLKEKLDFSGASKGLDDVSNAAKNVNMSGLGTAVEKVRVKFSALEAMGVAALVNIANQAVNTGKRIVSALTIEPVKTGFDEYELKMNSVQTILASTGEDLETVNGYLEELNEYADQTIYSFSDMTASIGKFTNAGVKLEDAVLAIKGISNEAAVSGANAEQASHAMYNFAQALSAGYVKLIDWKSIETANMATVEFKQTLIDTAVELGTVVKVGDKYKSTTTDLHGNVSELFTATSMFNDSLSAQWMSTEVLVETLKQYSDETTALGKKSFSAAQDIKTLSQLFDTLKEAAGSGWAQTWEIVIGDLYEAKALLTPISEALGGLIGKMSEARNTLLFDTMSSSYDKLIKKLNAAGIETETFEKVLTKTCKENGISLDKLIEKYGSLGKAIRNGKIPAEIFTKALRKLIGVENDTSKATEKITLSADELHKIATKVINGDFGTGKKRIEALTKAGYNYAEIQNEVNKILGIKYRHLVKNAEAQRILSQTESNSKKSIDALAKSLSVLEEISKSSKTSIDELVSTNNELSDAELKSKGYTEEQIKAFRTLKGHTEEQVRALKELSDAANGTGTSMSELINSMEKPSGKELILDTFIHLGKELNKILTALKEAFSKTFNKVTGDDVYSVIEKINELANSFEITEETASNFERIFEGLLALFELSTRVIKKGLITSIKLASAVLSLFGMTIMDALACVADYIVILKKWIDEHTLLINSCKKIAKIIKAVLDGVGKVMKTFMGLESVNKSIDKVTSSLENWFNAIKESLKIPTDVESVCAYITSLFDRLNNWLLSLDKSKHIGSDIIAGITNGIKSGVGKAIDAIVNLGRALIERIKKVLGIHSPSKKFYEIGSNIISGLVNAFRDGIPRVKEKISELAKACLNAFKKIDWGAIFASGIGVGIMVIGYKLSQVLENVTSPANGISKVLGSLASSIASFNKIVKAKALEIRANAILSLAKAIALLAASLAVLALIPAENLKKAGIALGSLAVGIAALAAILSKLNFTQTINFKELTVGLNKLNPTLVALSASVLLLAIAAKQLAGIPTNDLIKAGGTIAAFIVALTIACKVLDSSNVKGAGFGLLAMVIAVERMITITKKVGEMDLAELKQGQRALLLFAGIISILMLSSRLYSGKDIAKLGSTLFKMVAAIALMGIIVKMLGKTDAAELERGVSTITRFGLIIVALMAATRLASGKKLKKVGSTLLAVSASIAILGLIAKELGKVDSKQMAKGELAVAGLALIITGLIAATRLATKDKLRRVGLTMISVSASIGILAGIAAMIGLVKTEHLVKGIVAVGALSAMVSMMITATKGANECKNNMIVMAVLIGMLTASVIALSFIDSDKLMKSVAAISAVLFSLYLLTGATNKIASAEKKKILEAIGVIACLALVIGEVGAILALISALENKLDANATIETASSISLVLLAMAGVLKVISKIDLNEKNVKKSVFTLAGIGVIVGEIGVVLTLIAALENLVNANSTIETASSISLVLLAMASVLKAISRIDLNDKSVKKAIATLAGLGAIAGEIGVVLVLIAKLQQVMNVDSLIETTISISVLIKALASVLNTISMVDTKRAYSAIGALFVLELVVGAFIAFLTAMAKLNTSVDINISLETIAGISLLLIAMGTTLRIIAPIGAQAGQAVLAVLALEFFIATFTGVLAAIGKLTETPAAQEMIANGGKTLAAIGYALGDFVGSIVSGLGAGLTAGLPAIGENLSLFMQKVNPFVTGATNLNPNVLSGVKTLAETMLIIAAADLIDRITAFNSVKTSFLEFASMVPYLGVCMNQFAANLGTFGQDKVNAVTGAANAIKALAEAAKALPNDGGWAGKIFGDNSLASFGEILPDFAKHLCEFADNLAGFDTKKQEAVTNACEAIKSIASAATEIPNEGGWAAIIFGDNGLAPFGEVLPGFATNLKAFATNLGKFDKTAQDSISFACASIESIAKAAKEIPNEGGRLANIFGDNSIAVYSKYFPDLGKNLRSFADNIGTFNDTNKESIAKACETINTITSLLDVGLKEKDASALATVAPALGVLAESIKKWVGINVPSGFSEGMESISSSIKDFKMDKEDAESLKTVAPAVGTLAGSVSKWSKITFSDNMAESLSALFESISEFTLNEGKAKALDLIAPAVGMLADSVQKWNNITISDGLGTNLEGFAHGINAFWIGSEGKDALEGLTPLVGDLAEYVKAWIGIDIPDDLGDEIKEFAAGIKKLCIDPEDIVSLEKMSPILSSLVEPVKSWISISFPKDIGDSIKDFVKGIKKFIFDEEDAKSLSITAPAIGTLAESVKAWSKVNFVKDQIDNIKEFVKGIKEFIFTKSNAESLAIVAPAIGTLGESIKVWKEITVPDGLEAGLTGLGAGIKAFPTTKYDAEILTTIAPVIGVLGESVKKWKDISIPEELGGRVKSLAAGIGEFAYGSDKASIITAIVSTVSSLADSISKWIGIKIPEGLGESIKEFAEGLCNFSFTSEEAEALKVVSPAIGTLGDSVKKWVGIAIPEGIGDAIKDLAIGINKFSLSSEDATALTTVAPTVGTLADSVNKWVGITIPEKLGSAIEDLASGVNAFSFTSEEAEALTVIAPEIGTLADSVSKWTNIEIDDALGESIKGLAAGINKFAWSIDDSDKLSAALPLITPLSESVNAWNGITITEGFADALSEFGESLSYFGQEYKSYYNDIKTFNVETLANTTKELSSIIAVFKETSSIDETAVTNFGTNLKKIGETGISQFIDAFNESGDKVKSAGSTMVEKLLSGVNSKKQDLNNTFKALAETGISALNGKLSRFTDTGAAFIRNLVNGANSETENTKSAFIKIVDAIINSLMASGAGTPYSKFYDAGKYMVQGFAEGISKSTSIAEDAARAVARAAADAAAAELDEHSPSKVGYAIGNFFGRGFANGIISTNDNSYSAGSNMANAAKEGLTKAIMAVAKSLDDDFNMQPTIRPVLDLSDVESKMGKLSSMFGMNQVMSISSSMNTNPSRTIQNGAPASTSGNIYQFTQNNYSPKPLNRIEIYRQTRNQFSAMKGMVEHD